MVEHQSVALVSELSEVEAMLRFISAIVLLTFVLGDGTLQAQVTPPNQSISNEDPKIVAAIVALIGVVFSGLLSAIVSLILGSLTARNVVRSELVKRQSELALKISELVSSEQEIVSAAAMRRFAVGVVKILEPETHSEWGNVYFVPMNSRVTIGRAEDNDIVLNDENKWLSRWHCGFISDQHSVWIDDYLSTNGTIVNGDKICKPKILNSNDEIDLGTFKLRFQKIKENTILSQ
ncbi:MAG: FHA domain-containing protein [Xanthobacteraceae bacterium]